MALGLMPSNGREFTHKLRHDFKLLLYVILWICTAMAGPNVDNLSVSPKFLNILLCHWFTPSPDLNLLGHVKLGHLVNTDNAIYPNFPPYWDDFKPFVRQLLKEFFPSFSPLYSDSFDHKNMRVILENARGFVSETPNHITPGSSSDLPSHDRILQSVVTHAYLSSDMCNVCTKHQLDESDHYNPTTSHASKKANTADGSYALMDIARWQESVVM
jgi:hypothetical protein